jgi:hypothetical protein
LGVCYCLWLVWADKIGANDMSTVTVADGDFHRLIAERAQTLLGLADYLSRHSLGNECLVRPFLGEFHSQSVQLEELLDAYDAGNNCRWCSFRLLVAATKLFSDVSYELLHIQHVLPAYRLLPIERDFVKATDEALAFAGGVLSRAAGQMLVIAQRIALVVPATSPSKRPCAEELPVGRLARNCSRLRKGTVSETVTLLATAFLNLAAESRDVCAASRVSPEEYRSMSDSVSEESLRSLELRFHNLQSLYDTKVSGTKAEQQDMGLPVLRGHVSVVFHLLKTATLFAHYYERHVNKEPCPLSLLQEPLVTPEELLSVLVNYSITYISLYIGCAEDLCRQMLKRYAEIGRIEAPLPPYRGFHVRPATLISKLVLHYGSEVRMELNGELYDAGSPLELFRANEKINAQKRRWLAAEIVRLKLVGQGRDQDKVGVVVRDVISRLAEQSKLIIYEQPCQLPQESIPREGTLLESVTDVIAELLALGKIDVATDLVATFIGDKRVLADIRLLAESGYGEDKFGNNAPLPEKLAYLRR